MSSDRQIIPGTASEPGFQKKQEIITQYFLWYNQFKLTKSDQLQMSHRITASLEAALNKYFEFTALTGSRFNYHGKAIWPIEGTCDLKDVFAEALDLIEAPDFDQLHLETMPPYGANLKTITLDKAHAAIYSVYVQAVTETFDTITSVFAFGKPVVPNHPTLNLEFDRFIELVKNRFIEMTTERY